MWIRNESDVQDVCNLYVVVTMFHYGTMVFMVPSASKKHHSSESGSDSDDSLTMKPKNKKRKKRVSTIDGTSNGVEEVYGHQSVPKTQNSVYMYHYSVSVVGRCGGW